MLAGQGLADTCSGERVRAEGGLMGAHGGVLPASRTTLCVAHPVLCSCILVAFPSILACYLTFLSEFLFPCHAEGLQWKTCVLFLAQTLQSDPERSPMFFWPWFPTSKAIAHILFSGAV